MPGAYPTDWLHGAMRAMNPGNRVYPMPPTVQAVTRTPLSVPPARGNIADSIRAAIARAGIDHGKGDRGGPAGTYVMKPNGTGGMAKHFVPSGFIPNDSVRPQKRHEQPSFPQDVGSRGGRIVYEKNGTGGLTPRWVPDAGSLPPTADLAHSPQGTLGGYDRAPIQPYTNLGASPVGTAGGYDPVSGGVAPPTPRSPYAVGQHRNPSAAPAPFGVGALGPYASAMERDQDMAQRNERAMTGGDMRPRVGPAGLGGAWHAPLLGQITPEQERDYGSKEGKKLLAAMTPEARNERDRQLQYRDQIQWINNVTANYDLTDTGRAEIYGNANALMEKMPKRGTKGYTKANTEFQMVLKNMIAERVGMGTAQREAEQTGALSAEAQAAINGELANPSGAGGKVNTTAINAILAVDKQNQPAAFDERYSSNPLDVYNQVVYAAKQAADAKQAAKVKADAAAAKTGTVPTLGSDK